MSSQQQIRKPKPPRQPQPIDTRSPSGRTVLPY